MLISFKNIRDRSNAHALQVLTNNSVPIYLVLLAIIFVVFFAFIILIRKRTIAYANAYHIDAYDTHHFILLMIMYAMYFFILAVPMMIAWVTFINSGFVAKMANNIPINNPYEYVAALVLVLIITNAVPFMCAFIILYIDKKMDKARILCYPKTLTDNS